MAQERGPLPSVWETQMELLAPGFLFGPDQAAKVIWEMNQLKEGVALTLCLLNK